MIVDNNIFGIMIRNKYIEILNINDSNIYLIFLLIFNKFLM